MAPTLTVKTTTHGRVLVEDAADAVATRGTLVGFHGYGQSAEDMLAGLGSIPGSGDWTLVSIQALHRFYARDQQSVIASWMTRQDRDLAIADNVEYVNRALDQITGTEPSNHRTLEPSNRCVFLGFSQGVAMAYRAALLGTHAPAGIIALAGDVPPELVSADAASRVWPPVLLATGARDTWHTPARLAEDAARLRSLGVAHESLVFDGGHEWTDEFRRATADWLSRL